MFTGVFGVPDLNPQPNVPVIVLASGQPLKVNRVRLYETRLLNEIAAMRATAAQSLGGVHTGIGFWGSPSWALGGAAALGIVEGILSAAARKRAVELLNSAAQKYSEVVRRAVFFNSEQIFNISIPQPQAWYATHPTGVEFRHDGDDFVYLETPIGMLSIRWSHVAGYFPPQQPLSPVAEPTSAAPGGWPRLSGASRL